MSLHCSILFLLAIHPHQIGIAVDWYRSFRVTGLWRQSCICKHCANGIIVTTVRHVYASNFKETCLATLITHIDRPLSHMSRCRIFLLLADPWVDALCVMLHNEQCESLTSKAVHAHCSWMAFWEKSNVSYCIRSHVWLHGFERSVCWIIHVKVVRLSR